MGKKKTISILLTLILLISCSSYKVNAEVIEEKVPTITVLSINENNSGLAPGSTFEMQFKVENVDFEPNKIKLYGCINCYIKDKRDSATRFGHYYPSFTYNDTTQKFELDSDTLFESGTCEFNNSTKIWKVTGKIRDLNKDYGDGNTIYRFFFFNYVEFDLLENSDNTNSKITQNAILKFVEPDQYIYLICANCTNNIHYIDNLTDYEVDLKPTCTEKGSESKHCLICYKAVDETKKEIPATGHNYMATEVIETPTCVDKGLVSHLCFNCGQWIDEETDALGHDIVNESIAATCTAKGYKTVEKCVRCGGIFNQTGEIPALGHDWHFSRFSKKPTVFNKGLKEYNCNRCGAKKNEEVPKKEITSKDITNPTILSVKNIKDKKISVKWSKLKIASGYQVQYALNKKFTKSKKTITIDSTSKKITKLKKKKTYYVRVRAFAYDSSGKKIYGKWSKVKKVKIKK